ncbi:hypothetical protein ANN_21995 [Periplaneta americana]|uniref:Uncharacterized protein n=1 Tax=Periplaneta americana TaxID=6978 RepID=A0ABQ8S6X3_PERAM|nr:hypothetical protein ANN_21995 [Periplaneta americana]
MDLREVGYDDRDWINLAQDRDRWRAYRSLETSCELVESRELKELEVPRERPALNERASSKERKMSVVCGGKRGSFSATTVSMISGRQHLLKWIKSKRSNVLCPVVQQEEVESIPASSYECTIVQCLLHRLSDIRLMIGDNFEKTQPSNQPKWESNLCPSTAPDQQASTLAD